MRATQLHLVHFRSARDCTIALEPGGNLLAGVNGAGKTTVLDGMAILLSWAAKRLRSPKAGGRRILDTDIHNEKAFSFLELTCQTESHAEREVSWRLSKTRKGRNPENGHDGPLYKVTSLTRLNEWASACRDRIGDSPSNVNLPLFVHYPVHRAVLDIPHRIRRTHAFDVLDAYDDAFNISVNFREFFAWFRDREDLENERYRESGTLVKDTQLEAVRRAIAVFLPGFSGISVKRNPLRMVAVKDNTLLRVDQMSDGEKCLFALAGDLARRLAIANPDREDPLQGEGIVLIDEIDLHLHPAWQRMVVRRLEEAFPNCQFVITTHSPQVLGEVDARYVRRLSVDALHGLTATTPEQSLGLDASEILEELMETSSRNREVSTGPSAKFSRET